MHTNLRIAVRLAPLALAGLGTTATSQTLPQFSTEKPTTALCELTSAGPLAIPYWYVDSTTSSVLELNNPFDDERSVHLTARLAGVDAVDLGALVVPPETTARIPLRQLLPGLPPGAGGAPPTAAWGTGARPGSAWGTLTVDGETSGLRAWIWVTSKAESLATTPMMHAPAAGSPELVAQWWKPTARTDALYTVLNAGEATAQVLPTVHAGALAQAGHPLVLRPGEAALVSLNGLLGAASTLGARAGYVRFEALSPAARLVVHALLVDEAAGFSAPAAVAAPGQRDGRELQTPGVPYGAPDPALGFPAGTLFAPRLVASNVSAQPIPVSVYLQGTDAASGQWTCLLYTSPSPRDGLLSRMPSSA